MKAYQLPKLSISEYLAQEIDNKQRYEYHNGTIYALAGGSIEHGLLIGNIYSELRNELKKKGSNCKSITNDVKLHVKNGNKFLYPDTMVVCGDIERSEKLKDAITNPILIVEVLSKSTTNYDRGDKFYFYRQLDTLKEYVLIDQKRYLVEVFYKPEHLDLWKITRYEGIDQKITFQSIGIEIIMSELYFDIQL